MNLKKVLSFLVVIVMTVFAVPSAVFADKVTKEKDYYEIISAGIGASESYIRSQLEAAHNGSGVTYGFEWYIIAMLRAGKSVDENILNEYFISVAEEVKKWNTDVKPTDAERTALALTVMDRDITDVEGINLAELIYNNSRLNEGSNELAYALIALDAANVKIPEDSVWNRESIIDGILSFQAEDGGFGLGDNVSSDVDMTAICLQALAPYQSEENVKEVTDNAFSFLKENISEDDNYFGNVNSAAQVLLAAASFKIDVTNQGNNLFESIEKFRDTDGNGYIYEDTVSSMSTVQVMQSYDAYRKAHKEDILYWDFSTVGAAYEDDADNESSEEENESAEPATVYVTIASDGNIVKDKNDEYVAQVPITVIDRDHSGALTVDEALYAVHEEYYDGGAEKGYNTFMGTYGLSLGVLWGKGTPGTSAAAGYWLNNASCWSLNDEVSEGDYLTAFNYCDTVYWSDSYSFFDKNEVTAKSGASAKITLNKSGYDTEWNPVVLPCEGAKIIFLGSEIPQDMTTDEKGQIKISLKNVPQGEYYVMAYSDAEILVPAVCKINVTKKSTSSSSGGGGSYNKTEEKAPEDKPEIKEDKNTEEIPVTQMPKPHVFAENTFSDVKQGDWYYDSVKYVYENNLMQGTENVFEPDGRMTRAMLVTILYRMSKPEEDSSNNIFTDVTSDKWYSEAVMWAAANGIVNGITETEFAPDAEVSREQVATILYRYAKLNDYDVSVKKDISYFEDSAKISNWAMDALEWANSKELITGISETVLSPEKSSTRGQIATIIMRFCENVVK